MKVVCNRSLWSSPSPDPAHQVQNPLPVKTRGLPFGSSSLHQACQGVDGVKAYGIEKLIQLAASQLNDQLPESREAAPALLFDPRNVYDKTLDMMPTDVSENPQTISWEHFYQLKLSPLRAQAVLHVTNVAW